jgi:hypothetical protein
LHPRLKSIRRRARFRDPRFDPDQTNANFSLATTAISPAVTTTAPAAPSS